MCTLSLHIFHVDLRVYIRCILIPHGNTGGAGQVYMNVPYGIQVYISVY